MSAAAATNYNDTSNPISDDHEVFSLHPARQTGRRNAVVDLGTQFAQVNSSIITCDVDEMTPHFKSMSIKP